MDIAVLFLCVPVERLCLVRLFLPSADIISGLFLILMMKDKRNCHVMPGNCGVDGRRSPVREKWYIKRASFFES